MHGGVTPKAGGEGWTGNTAPLNDTFVVVPSSGRATTAGFASERKLVVVSVDSGVYENPETTLSFFVTAVPI